MIRDFLGKIFSSESENESQSESLDSFEEVETEINGLREEIEELNNSIESLKRNQLDKVNTNFKSIQNLDDALETHYKAIEELLELIGNNESSSKFKELNKRLKDVEKELDDLKGFVKGSGGCIEDPKDRISRSINRHSDQSGRNESMEDKAEGVIEGELLWEKTTPAQKNVLQTLYKSGYYMTYNEIANKLNRSVSTVKNHINTLKSMGVEFKETREGNNSKKYMLDDRIKSYLTMKLND